MNFGLQTPAQKVYDGVLNLISEGKLRPGEHIPTLPLATQFGVSRTPVSEALKRLASEGIVRFKAGNGAWLIKPTAEEVRDIYVVRRSLEVTALKLAFDGYKAQDFIEAKKNIELEKIYNECGDKINCIKVGLDFHLNLLTPCKNTFIIKFLNSILTTNFAYLILLEYSKQRLINERPNDHSILLEYIMMRDEDKSVSFLSDHIVDSFNISFPQWQDNSYFK